jgi:hypothetical protein
MNKSIIYASTHDVYDTLVKRGVSIDKGSPLYAISVAPRKYEETTMSFSPEIEATLKANQLAKAGKRSEAQALIDEQKQNVLNKSLRGHLAVQAMLGPQPGIRKEPEIEAPETLEQISAVRAGATPSIQSGNVSGVVSGSSSGFGTPITASFFD